MARLGARSTWMIPAALLVLAVVLLALSFAPGPSQKAADGPTAVAVAATPTDPPPAPTTTPTRPPAEIGRVLFGIKGCATCHRHDGLTDKRLAQGGQSVQVNRALVGANGAPDLTHYQPDPDFIRTWLKDPQAIRPNTLMPDLGLSEVEIEALLAFLQTNTAVE